MAAMVFGFLVAFVTAGFLWFYIVRPILEDFEVIGSRDVNYYQVDETEQPCVMSRQPALKAPDERQTKQTDRVSEADQWMERLRVDKTKMTLIELTAYSGWSVDEIRKAIKGDNGVLGAEIEGARKRQGIEPEPAYVTPIVGRATSAKFETDPDFPFEPCRS